MSSASSVDALILHSKDMGVSALKSELAQGEKMKQGLVMEGGAMRGMFTAGVLDVLMENGISFDGAIGVSAGATFGCNIKSGQKGRAIRYNLKFCGDPRYGTFKSLLKTGDFFDVDFCYHEIPGVLDIWDKEAFAKNPMEFYVVATDIESGEAVYHKCTDGGDEDLEWIRASASVPIISRYVEIEGKKLLDGGIADSVPLAFFEKEGYSRNLVILTQPDSYVKKKNKAVPVCNIKYRDYPAFKEVFANRHIRYKANIDYIREQEEKGVAFVIRPPYKLDLSSAEKNPEKLKKAYELGRSEASIAINERGLVEWLAK